MSIAEDIANLTAKFTEEKTKEVLEGMSLDEISQVWSDIQLAQNAPTNTAEEKSAQSKDFAERSQVLHEVITPEALQSKMNQYLEGLANGTYSPADFTKISEFCADFNDDFKNDAIKNSLDELQKRMADKRLEVENGITIIPDEKTSQMLKLNIEELDSITIEGDKEKISVLTDKNQIQGKTVTFKDSNGEDLAGVEFAENGNADILVRDEEGMAVQYQITADGHFSKIINGNAFEIDKENLSDEHKQAYHYATSAKRVWDGYKKGELDNSIEKEIKVNEGKTATKVNENRTKTTVNQKTESTKIDENNEELDGPTSTKFNEEESTAKQEADLTGDTKKEKPTAEDELYWKEGDIIDTMFKEWFLAAANSVTNWVVHQIEYTAAGIWDEFEKSYIERKAERQKEIDDAKKKDATQEFYGKIEDVGDKYMAELCSGFGGKDKSKAKNQDIIQQINEGKIDDVIANTPLLQSLKDFHIDPKQMLLAGNPESTVPFVTGMATMAAKFADDYARASILNERMNNKDAFKGRDASELYETKRKEAMLALKCQMIEDQKKNPNSNASELMFKSIKECNGQISEALKISINDFDNRQYIDNGKNPHKNEILEHFESLANPPQTMQDEAQRITATEAQINFVRSGLEMEGANLGADEDNLTLRRQRLNQTRAFINGGLPQIPLANTPNRPQVQIPLRPQGRE